MSNRNKHSTNHENGVAEQYLKDELGPRKQCTRRSCKGMCVEVHVQYTDHGPVHCEFECTICGKVIKDPRYRYDRQQRWQQKSLLQVHSHKR